nr:xanthine dehydrogenase family protein molybdopterin-binding subunit [bacterium]
MAFQYIGKNIIRPDLVGKVTGKVRFLDDIRLPGMLYAEFLRPEHAHARILSIDVSAAEAAPGVVKVVTGKGCEFRYGDNIRDLVPMAVDRVTYIGQPVAAVIARSAREARAAAAAIEVEYEPLPALVDARDALAEGAVLIHPDSGEFWHLPGIEPVAGTNIANRYTLR